LVEDSKIFCVEMNKYIFGIHTCWECIGLESNPANLLASLLFDYSLNAGADLLFCAILSFFACCSVVYISSSFWPFIYFLYILFLFLYFISVFLFVFCVYCVYQIANLCRLGIHAPIIINILAAVPIGSISEIFFSAFFFFAFAYFATENQFE
jgi:hypothetical protein